MAAAFPPRGPRFWLGLVLLLLAVGFLTRPARADALLGFVLEVRACNAAGPCRALPTRGTVLVRYVCEARAGAILEALGDLPREVLPVADGETRLEVRCAPVRGDREA